MKWFLYLYLVQIAFVQSVLADTIDPSIGGELTFTRDDVRNADYSLEGGLISTTSPENRKARDEIAAAARLASSYKHTVVEEHVDRYGIFFYRVRFSDGWFFDITCDPYVIEIKTFFRSVAELERMEQRLQQEIFDFMADLGFYPLRDVGGGHGHFGAESMFRNNTKLLHNIIVDDFLHPELRLGAEIFENWDDEAPKAPGALFALETLGRDLLDNRIGDYSHYAQRLEQEVYIPFDNHGRPPFKARKYVSQNVTKIVDNSDLFLRTLEHRGMRTHLTARSFVLFAKLRVKRFNYLNSVPTIINIQPPKYEKKGDILRAYHDYLVQSGITDPAEYIELLPRDEVWRSKWRKICKEREVHLPRNQSSELEARVEVPVMQQTPVIFYSSPVAVSQPTQTVQAPVIQKRVFRFNFNLSNGYVSFYESASQDVIGNGFSFDSENLNTSFGIPRGSSVYIYVYGGNMQIQSDVPIAVESHLSNLRIPSCAQVISSSMSNVSRY